MLRGPALIISAAFSLAANAAWAASPNPGLNQALPSLSDTLPSVVATVNGRPLTREQLGAVAASLYGPVLLDELIAQEVVRQEVTRAGITASPDEVEAYLTKRVTEEMELYARQIGASGLDDLRKKGISEERIAALRAQTEARLRPTAELGLLAFKRLTRDLTVDEPQLRAEYERRHGAKARGLQIVVPSRERADEVLAKLTGGADFASIAREFSIDRVTARNGGEMPPLSKGSLLGDALFALAPGRLSQPVQTPDGFHVLKLIERIPATGITFDAARKEIETALLEQAAMRARDKWLLQLIEKADVQRNVNFGHSSTPPPEKKP